MIKCIERATLFRAKWTKKKYARRNVVYIFLTCCSTELIAKSRARVVDVYVSAFNKGLEFLGFIYTTYNIIYLHLL